MGRTYYVVEAEKLKEGITRVALQELEPADAIHKSELLQKIEHYRMLGESIEAGNYGDASQLEDYANALTLDLSRMRSEMYAIIGPTGQQVDLYITLKGDFKAGDVFKPFG